MSMHKYISIGKKLDEKYFKYKKVWDICTEAGVDIPEEVVEYFGDRTPDGLALWEQVQQNYDTGQFEQEAFFETTNDGENNIILDISKLPKDINLVKFTLSY